MRKLSVRGGLTTAMIAAATAFGASQTTHALFDGSSAQGWILCNHKPLSKDHVQADGLNPHGTGSYLVVHEKTFEDFVLDFDYKLSKGCNSGVFIRTNDLDDPVNTGIEIALDDTTGHGMHDSGALYDLVAPSENAQKPAGEWNHMTVTARGPVIAVAINGKPVSTINLDQWQTAGKRPDGSKHKFKNVAIGKLPRRGYFGFQDHGSDCWYRNVTIKE